MSFPNFIPNWEIVTKVDYKELLSCTKAIAQIFSDRSEKVEDFVWKTLDDSGHILPEFYNAPERVNFASEYYDEQISDENWMHSMPENPSEGVFRLLTKYPNIIKVLLEETGKIRFGKDMFFTPGFEIPLEDIFGILSLLYKFPGRSGATNRELLRVFTKEYSPVIWKGKWSFLEIWEIINKIPEVSFGEFRRWYN